MNITGCFPSKTVKWRFLLHPVSCVWWPKRNKPTCLVLLPVLMSTVRNFRVFFLVWDGLGGPGQFSDELKWFARGLRDGIYTPRLSRNLLITLKIGLSFFFEDAQKKTAEKREKKRFIKKSCKGSDEGRNRASASCYPVLIFDVKKYITCTSYSSSKQKSCTALRRGKSFMPHKIVRLLRPQPQKINDPSLISIFKERDSSSTLVT